MPALACSASATDFVPASFLIGASCVLPEPVQPAWPPRLTLAEREVLRLLAAGCSNKEIASTLGKAEPTIKHQVSSILEKAGVQSRAQLLVRLFRRWPAA